MGHNLEVVLVVTSPDLTKPGNSRFLLLQGEDGKYRLPTAPVGDDQSTLEVAAKLLHQLTGLKARILGVGWVDLVAMPLADSVERREVNPCDRIGGCLRHLEPPAECKCDPDGRFRGPRVIGVPYGAMLPGEVVKLTDTAAKWVPLIEAFEGEFFLDHRQILEDACHRI